MMTNRLLFLAASLAGLAQLAGCSKRSGEEKITGSPSDAPVELISQWQGSNRYTFHLEMATATETPRPNQPEPVHLETTVEQEYAVVVTNTLPNGARGLELEVLSLRLDTADADKYVLNFDSENPAMGNDGSPQAEALQKLIGTRLWYRVGPDNTVLELDGLRALMDRIGKADERGAGQSFFRKTLGQEFFKRLLETPPLPGKPVRVGESWTTSRTVSAGSREIVPVTLTYTFKGWQKLENKRCALVEFTGDIQFSTNAASRPRALLQGIEAGTVRGKTWFDLEAGFARRTVSDQAFTLRAASRRSRATNAAPSTVLVKLRQHNSITLLEISPWAH